MSIVKKLIDIGANLTDPMFQGIYHGSTKHQNDLSAVLERSWKHGLTKMIITGGNLEESEKALDLAKTNDSLYSTVGCHPTRCNEFDYSNDAEGYLSSLATLAKENKGKIVAVGECGLDYDRLQFCPANVQKKYFDKQLNMCYDVKLPLFLHCRNAAKDFIEILNAHKDNLYGGVVHSFDGSKEEAATLIDMGFYIGLNGCSLKTEDNLQVVSTLPVDRIMIETDCPWCEVRPTHAGYKYVKSTFPTVKKEKWQPGSMVKARNEPCQIIQVLEVIAGVRNDDIDVLCQQIYENTEKVFFPL